MGAEDIAAKSGKDNISTSGNGDASGAGASEGNGGNSTKESTNPGDDSKNNENERGEGKPESSDNNEQGKKKTGGTSSGDSGSSADEKDGTEGLDKTLDATENLVKDAAILAASTATGIPVDKIIKAADAGKKGVQKIQNVAKKRDKKEADDVAREKKRKKWSRRILVIIIILLPIILISIFITTLTSFSVFSIWSTNYSGEIYRMIYNLNDDINKESAKAQALLDQSTKEDNWLEKTRLMFEATISGTSVTFKRGAQGVLIKVYNTGDWWTRKDQINNYQLQPWGPDNEFYYPYGENGDIAKTACRESYKLALEESKENVKNRPNYNGGLGRIYKLSSLTNTWEKVFEKNANYGYMIASLNAQYDQLKEENDVDFDSKNFEDFIFDKESMKHYYEIDYRDYDVDYYDEDGNYLYTRSYTEVTIYPFSKESLLLITNNTPDTKYQKDNKNSPTTYGDMIDSRFMQTKAELQGDQYAKVYNYLNLDIEVKEKFSNFKKGSLTGNIATKISFDSNDVCKYIYQELHIRGFTDEGIAGILGNLQQENGFSGKWAGHGSSVGLCQWGGGRRTNLEAYLNQHGYALNDVIGQADFLMNVEMSTSSGQFNFMGYPLNGNQVKGEEMLKYLMNCTDVYEATDIFARSFERCSNRTDPSMPNPKEKGNEGISPSRYAYSECCDIYMIDLTERRQYAQTWYDAIKCGMLGGVSRTIAGRGMTKDEIETIIEQISDPAAKKACEFALSYVGCDYSQYDRYNTNPPRFDCSSLVGRAWEYAGNGFWAQGTAQSEYNKFVNGDIANGSVILFANEKGDISSNNIAELMPGDILFYWSVNNKYISHTNIYVGGGMVVNASGKNDRDSFDPTPNGVQYKPVYFETTSSYCKAVCRIYSN